jgi:protein-tyrosine phosphatase
MRSIIPGLLWIGSARDARDVRGLMDLEIAAIVNLALEEPPVVYPREVVCLRIPLLDGEGNSAELLSLAVGSIASLLAARLPTLVACSAGMSRSPILAAAAMAMVQGTSFEAALAEITAGGPHDCSPALWRDVRNLM